jgi:hypothetical protein
MVNIVTLISSSIEEGKRILKFLRYGKEDIQTSFESSPYGVDSVPIEKLKGVYSISESGKKVLLGYINTNQIAEIGETRLFSTDENGALQMWLHLKNDGTAEFFGSDDNFVRYSKLEEAFNELKSDFNSLVQSYNSHIHTTTATISATAVPGVIAPTTATGSSSGADISPAKIEELKTA